MEKQRDLRAGFRKSVDVTKVMEDAFAQSCETGLSEFPSEVNDSFDELNATVPMQHAARDQASIDAVHEDIRKALQEMRSMHYDSLVAFAELRLNLIRWIVGTGILVVVLARLL